MGCKLIDELLEWKIENRNVRDLGKRVREINRQFCILSESLEDVCEKDIPDMTLSRKLLPRIKEQIKRSKRLKPSDKFDSICLDEFRDNLEAQREYIEFFFTQKYSKIYGVNSFLNWVFLPPEDFNSSDDPSNKQALEFLEGHLSSINFPANAKRNQLMWEINNFQINRDPDRLAKLMAGQIQRIRGMLSHYNSEMGFISKEEVKTHDLIHAREREIKDMERLKSILGSTYNGVFHIIESQRRQNGLALQPETNFNQGLNKLLYEMVFSDRDECTYDPGNRTIEVGRNYLYFYHDKDSGEVKLYSGDLDIFMGHENTHRLQYYFSEGMPAGLSNEIGEYNLTGSTIFEGVALACEPHYLEWLGNNRSKYDLSKKDLELAKLKNPVYFSNLIIRLCHSIYHRVESSLERNDDLNAHERLAKKSKIPVLADEDYLANESLPEVYDFGFYFFGQRYVEETLKELHATEKRRFEQKKGMTSSWARRKATRFINKNTPIVMQGLMTGNWGWRNHQDFFLKHYWPKARKYCEE